MFWNHIPTEELRNYIREINAEIARRPADYKPPLIKQYTDGINPEMVKALRPVTVKGGPLYGGHRVKSTTLSALNRPWRRLLADLKCDENSERFKLATRLLAELGVSYTDGDNNSRTFFLNSF